LTGLLTSGLFRKYPVLEKFKILNIFLKITIF